MCIKKLGLLVILLICSNSAYASTCESDFDWLLGKWQRSNDSQGRKTTEIWQKVSEGEYTGVSYTLQGNDVIWQENLRLTSKQSGWSLSVISEGETLATEFRLTDIGCRFFLSENLDNSFPTHIQYAKSDDSLGAQVSDSNNKIIFAFLSVKD